MDKEIQEELKDELRTNRKDSQTSLTLKKKCIYKPRRNKPENQFLKVVVEVREYYEEEEECPIAKIVSSMVTNGQIVFEVELWNG